MAPPPDGDLRDGRLVSSIFLSAALALGCKPAAPPTPVLVAAASDLTVAFEEMGTLFEARTGQKVNFSFGASGALAKQLGQGAPFDLFAAANASFVDSAVTAGACDGATKALYARGHIVVWTRQGTTAVKTLSDLLADNVAHIAIANPEHAPYGKAAKEALTRAGLWGALERKIVHAENVRQALQFAETGNADAAIVALSLVAKNNVGQQLLVPTDLYTPLKQALVVCRHGKNAAGARAFAELVESKAGQTLLERYGFGTSGEEPRQ